MASVSQPRILGQNRHQFRSVLPEYFGFPVPATDVTQEEAEETTRLLASQEGIFAGVSSGGAVSAALRLSRELENSVIVVIVCDRGDRYLSTGVFPDC